LGRLGEVVKTQVGRGWFWRLAAANVEMVVCIISVSDFQDRGRG